jgi:hypothetical protein
MYSFSGSVKWVRMHSFDQASWPPVKVQHDKIGLAHVSSDDRIPRPPSSGSFEDFSFTSSRRRTFLVTAPISTSALSSKRKARNKVTMSWRRLKTNLVMIIRYWFAEKRMHYIKQVP